MPPSFPRQNQAVVLRSACLPSLGYAYGTVTLYGGAFQPTSASPAGGHRRASCNPTSPRAFARGFGLGSPPFGRPYSGDPILVSSPPPTKMLPFGGFPLGTPAYAVSRAPQAIRPRQEVPFGDPRIYGCVRLPGAYRSLPRPSSAPEPSHPPSGLAALTLPMQTRSA